MSERDALAARFKRLAETAGSVTALARSCGVPQRTMANYCDGEREPKTTDLVRIAQAVSVRIEWLAAGVEPMRLGEPDQVPNTSGSRTLLRHGDFKQEDGVSDDISTGYEGNPNSVRLDTVRALKSVLKPAPPEPQLESTTPPRDPVLEVLKLRFPDEGAAARQARMIPVVGFASCGLRSWFKGKQDLGEIPTTFDLLNDQSFAVKAIGESMEPEGIRPRYLCFCNPTRPLGKRDAVYVLRKDGTATIKLYLGKTEKGWYHLQGWLDPDRNDHQDTFMEQISPDWVHEIAPIIYVRRAP